MILFDVLVATLIVYPWLTDWAWIQIPGVVFVQPADFGVPLLVVALVILAITRGRLALSAVEPRRRELIGALARAPGRVLAWTVAVLTGIVLLVILAHW